MRLGIIFCMWTTVSILTLTEIKSTLEAFRTVIAMFIHMFFCVLSCRIAVFSIEVLKDERIVIIAEQRPDCPEEESFQWMSRVLQAVDSIHQVGVYCLALVPPNYLPKVCFLKTVLTIFCLYIEFLLSVQLLLWWHEKYYHKGSLMKITDSSVTWTFII